MAKWTSISLMLFKVGDFELHQDLHIRNQAKYRNTLTKQIFSPQDLQLLSQLKELVFHLIHLLINIWTLRRLGMVDGVLNTRQSVNNWRRNRHDWG